MATASSKNQRMAHLAVDLSSLPKTQDLSPSRIAAGLMIAFGAIWVFIVRQFVWPDDGFMSSAGLFELAIGSVPVLIGIGMVLGGISSLIRKRRATFGIDGVTVEGRSLAGSESWYQPYTAYKGVLHREEVVSNKNSTTTYQLIELLHEDRKKCIPLYKRATTEMPRAQWEAYARQLKLPALEEEESGVFGRAHDTLDKSLQEQVEDGSVSHAFKPGSPPPKGLRVAHVGADSMIVTITSPRYPLWIFAIFIFFGLAQMAGAFFNDAYPVLLFGVGALVAGVSGYALFRDRASHRELRLDRHRMSLREPMALGRRGADSLSFDEIESIVVREARGNLGRELVIASDGGSMHVGAGLSRVALAWLKDFLTAAIATA